MRDTLCNNMTTSYWKILLYITLLQRGLVFVNICETPFLKIKTKRTFIIIKSNKFVRVFPRFLQQGYHKTMIHAEIICTSSSMENCINVRIHVCVFYMRCKIIPTVSNTATSNTIYDRFPFTVQCNEHVTHILLPPTYVHCTR